ncbi:transmembrane emp24 domain-containing protein 1-like [Lytechinus pictus]|uniref:transmembrane emp24 domain-containing protein 1-like n=1 Tax=Lytechinus pictus TaxID=7653 RepID=UPI0030B9B2D6
MCFDNSFSRMSEKIVYFDLALDYEDEGESDVPKWMDAVANRNEEVEITMEEIQTSLDIVSDNLRKSQTHQRQWRNIEFRDRYLTERNFERVNFWSSVNTIVMLVTLIIQVIMIRSLFANNTKVRT